MNRSLVLGVRSALLHIEHERRIFPLRVFARNFSRVGALFSPQLVWIIDSETGMISIEGGHDEGSGKSVFDSLAFGDTPGK